MPGQVLDRGRHLVAAEVGPAESDTEIRQSRFQGEVDLVAGVKSDSDAGDLTANCALCVH